jgi:tyrosinase
MSVAKLNARRKKAGLPLLRFNVRRLLPDDVQDLRDAFAAMYEISELAAGDARGFWAFARGHGYDEDLCHNDARVFLTWHRAYAYMFEKGLSSALKWKRKDDELELTLPFWDWTVFDPATDAANGIPKILDDATYYSAPGVTTVNPLATAPSLYRTASQSLSGPQSFTTRYPGGLRGVIPQLKNNIERYLTNPDFGRFSDDFDFGAHGTVHVNVGGQDPSSPLPFEYGDMTSITSAAYDPIFWLHHAMVDKVWFDWQTEQSDATVPQHVRDTIVYGGFRGEELLDAERSLRYIYSDEEVEAAEEVGGTVDDAAEVDDGHAAPHAVIAAPAAPAAPTAPTAGPLSSTIRVGNVRGPFKRAQLDFHQLRPPKRSHEVRAFINNPNATDATPIDDPSYGGTLMLFGHGQCHGAPGHCNPQLAKRDDYDLRPKHPLRFEHTTYNIDVTRGLRRTLAKSGVTGAIPIDVTLVVVGPDRKAVDPRALKHRGISLATRS